MVNVQGRGGRDFVSAFGSGCRRGSDLCAPACHLHCRIGHIGQINPFPETKSNLITLPLCVSTATTMPAVLYASSAKDTREGFTLALNARHTLNAGKDVATMIKATSRLPNIDVVHRGDVVLILRGVSDGRKVPASAMASASPSAHLTDYLKAAGFIHTLGN